jgi:hypothetical protein
MGGTLAVLATRRARVEDVDDGRGDEIDCAQRVTGGTAYVVND